MLAARQGLIDFYFNNVTFLGPSLSKLCSNFYLLCFEHCNCSKVTDYAQYHAHINFDRID